MTTAADTVHQFTPRYACPRTGEPLHPEGDGLHGPTGVRRYAVRNGIPNFLSYPSVETAEEVANLERLNELAVTKGWREALDAVFGAGSGMTTYVTDTRRTACLDLLPLHPTSSVLEIGPGLGQFTVIIGPRVGHVSALEIVPGQAEFAAERCRQSGVTNASFAVGGDDCRLPYQASSFNVVICNLVLEWCPGRDTSGNPEELQRRLLSEMARVLKPGGVAYVNTKNRYALKYLAGNPDEHAYQTRFGNALPRPVLNAWLARKGKPQPRAMLHSHNYLRRMILTSGFRSAESYWAAPEMRTPACFVPTDSRSIRAARRRGIPQGDSRSTRLVMPWIPAGLVRHFTAGLTFIAQKAG